MGFFFKKTVFGHHRFVIKGDDIIYAMQFPETEWGSKIFIELPSFEYPFEKDQEYFLKIENGKIICVWEYDDFVPEFPKNINEEAVKKKLCHLRKTRKDLEREAKKYKQPTFPLVVKCHNLTKDCVSFARPKLANYFACLYEEEMFVPSRPYICFMCLEDPPIIKEEQEINIRPPM